MYEAPNETYSWKVGLILLKNGAIYIGKKEKRKKGMIFIIWAS